MTAAGWFILALAALAVGSLLSTIHQSLRDCKRMVVEGMARARGERVHRSASAVLDDPDAYAAGVAFPRIVANLIVVVSAVLGVTSLRGQGTPGVLEQAVGILGSALLLWVFGVVVPHVLAKHAGDAIVVRWLWLIRGVFWFARPGIRIVDAVDDLAQRRMGTDEGVQLEDELRSVVEEGKLAGQFDQRDQAMIEAVVGLRDRTVEQIMTPRTDVTALSAASNLGDVVAFIRRHRRSRFPVFDRDLDHVVGVFYVKDLLQWLAGSDRARPGFDLRAILRMPMFVPETKTVRELLEELRARRTHIAIVANEYGTMSGIVTMEDVIEEVFGDIADEHEAHEASSPPEVNVEERWAMLDARLRIGEANGALRPIGIELPEDEGYDTIAGFVAARMGRIPEAGEAFNEGRVRVTVLEAAPTRVGTVKVEAGDGADER